MIIVKTVIVTGASSGIGLATAKLFCEKGCSVYDFSRSGTDDGKISHITCDVTDEESVKNAVSQVIEKEGKIDVLVNNAGFGISGAAENTDTDKAKKQFDVNFFGTFNVSKAVIPFMRERKSGMIINISSMAAPLAIPFQLFYSASKSAINSFTLALANEVRPFNIKVCAVMPGDVRTGFTAAREKDDDSGAYSAVLSKSVSTMEHDEENGMSPAQIAKAVYALSLKKNPKPISTVGFQYKAFAFLAKALPTRAVNYIIGQLYAK